MKKLTEEQKEKLQQIKETKEKEITPLDALYEIKKQIGNIHVFTDEIPPQQTNIELRNSVLFEIVDKELWESIKNRGWIKELLECKQKLEEELALIKRHKVFLAFEIIEKELKAFDIVISKVQLGGFITALQQTKNYEEYKNTYITLLTRKEYDLLKEVLSDGQ